MNSRQRSLAQNRYLFGPAYGVIVEAMQIAHPLKPWLHNKEMWHEHWCEEYFGRVEIGFPGSGKYRPRRTTTTNEIGKRDVISTTKFDEFKTLIQAACAEHGIDIPDPNEPPLQEYAA